MNRARGIAGLAALKSASLVFAKGAHLGARYHPARHELTINADFRAISDLITHWQDRYKGVPGARAVIEAHVREWCEQILVEVVLAARASTRSAEQLEALLSPTAFTVALLPTPPAVRGSAEARAREKAERSLTDYDRGSGRVSPAPPRPAMSIETANTSPAA